MRRLRALPYAALYVATLLAALWSTIELVGYAPTPSRPTQTAGGGLRVERGTQHILRLWGSPYALGFHNARLLGSTMDAQEELLLDSLFTFAGTPARAMVVRQLGLVYLAGLDAYLREPERQEILGLAEGNPDSMPFLGPRYTRLAAYHAAHELSHRFAFDSPFTAACSLVAVSAARSHDGHAYLARNFDFEGGDVFDRDKVVVAVTPDSGYRFVSVSWSGMAGVVSGINEHGLAITLNAGASGDYRRVGVPTTLLVRRALEEARTIDEALPVLTSAPPFISDILGLADATGRVAVLELTPRRHALREGQLLLATNQFESESLRSDPVSRERERISTTRQRRQRLATAIGEEPLAVTDLLALLRDRRSAQNTPLALGHRHAIDALIATHSVIFDATARQIWVSEGPHTLGPYHGYDVRALLQADDTASIEASYLPSLAADALLQRAPLFQRARLAWTQAERAIGSGDGDAALRILRDAVALSDHPTTLWLRGRALALQGDKAGAAAAFDAALRAPPEYPRDEERLRAALDHGANR